MIYRYFYNDAERRKHNIYKKTPKKQKFTPKYLPKAPDVTKNHKKRPPKPGSLAEAIANTDGKTALNHLQTQQIHDSFAHAYGNTYGYDIIKLPEGDIMMTVGGTRDEKDWRENFKDALKRPLDWYKQTRGINKKGPKTDAEQWAAYYDQIARDNNVTVISSHSRAGHVINLMKYDTYYVTVDGAQVLNQGPTNMLNIHQGESPTTIVKNVEKRVENQAEYAQTVVKPLASANPWAGAAAEGGYLLHEAATTFKEFFDQGGLAGNPWRKGNYTNYTNTREQPFHSVIDDNQNFTDPPKEDYADNNFNPYNSTLNKFKNFFKDKIAPQNKRALIHVE